MITPPFTKVVWGKQQHLAARPQSPNRDRRVRMWLRRLYRARDIVDCSEQRFKRRWQSRLPEAELQAALKHRHDPDLWLDSLLIIEERIGYYQALL